MNISGEWLSQYEYNSSSRDELTGEHTIVFEQNESTATGKSQNDPRGSELSLVLNLDNHLATGTWREKTSPTGHYRGDVFIGATQLIVSENGEAMYGKWVGHSKDKTRVKTGDWHLKKQ